MWSELWREHQNDYFRRQGWDLRVDPAVDAEGVPVAGKALAQAGAQIAVQAGKPQPGTGAGVPLSGSGAHGEVKKGPTVGGHVEPPRVVAGQAAQILQEMHKNAEEVLKGTRGSRPLPRPRPSA